VSDDHVRAPRRLVEVDSFRRLALAADHADFTPALFAEKTHAGLWGTAVLGQYGGGREGGGESESAYMGGRAMSRPF
jgi:hypothetical protein